MLLRRSRNKPRIIVTLAVVLHLASGVSFAEQPPASVGPADPAAADLLFKEAQNQIQNHLYSEAARSLERLLARYPSHPSNLEARLMLGRSYVETNKAAESVQPLQEYVSRVKTANEKVAGRLALVTAYQALSKPHEMMTTAQEILATKPISPATRAQALIYRGHAQFALKNVLAAKRSLDQAQVILATSEAESAEYRPIHANLESLRLQLQLDQCNAISDAKKPSESAALGIVTRTGQCLMQALLTFNALTQWDEHGISGSSSDSVYNAYAKLKRFLVDGGKGAPQLVEKYDRYIDESLEMISHWKSTSLPVKERTLSKMRERLQQLRSR